MSDVLRSAGPWPQAVFPALVCGPLPAPAWAPLAGGSRGVGRGQASMWPPWTSVQRGLHICSDSLCKHPLPEASLPRPPGPEAPWVPRSQGPRMGPLAAPRTVPGEASGQLVPGSGSPSRTVLPRPPVPGPRALGKELGHFLSVVRAGKGLAVCGRPRSSPAWSLSPSSIPPPKKGPPSPSWLLLPGRHPLRPHRLLPAIPPFLWAKLPLPRGSCWLSVCLSAAELKPHLPPTSRAQGAASHRGMKNRARNKGDNPRRLPRPRFLRPRSPESSVPAGTVPPSLPSSCLLSVSLYFQLFPPVFSLKFHRQNELLQKDWVSDGLCTTPREDSGLQFSKYSRSFSGAPGTHALCSLLGSVPAVPLPSPQGAPRSAWGRVLCQGVGPPRPPSRPGADFGILWWPGQGLGVRNSPPVRRGRPSPTASFAAGVWVGARMRAGGSCAGRLYPSLGGALEGCPPQDWAQRLISSSTAAGRCHLSSQVVATETLSAGPPGSPLPGLEGWQAGNKLEEPQTWFESSSRPAPGPGSREGYLLWTWGGQGTSADEALGTDPLSSCEVPALPPGGAYISQCAQEGRVWRPSAPDHEWCVQAAGAQHGAPRGPARICLCHHRVDEPVSGLFPRRAQCGTSWGPGPRRGLLRSTGEARKAGTEPSLSSHVATCRPLDTGRAVCAAWVSVPPSPSAGNRTASPGSTRAGAGGQ